MRRPRDLGPRRNERVRAPEVRVIGPDGKQAGVMSSMDARKLAQSYGLDLLEVSPNAKPPVCRILDYGKYMYEQSKRQKESKQNSSAQKLKEIKFRVSIDTHDFETKIRRAEGFAMKGNKLKLTLMFRGREMEHTELGFDTVKRAIEFLSTVAVLDNEPRLSGRMITCTLSPLPAQKRKPRFLHSEDDDDSGDADDSDESDDSGEDSED